jgi:hypothetical protein
MGARCVCDNGITPHHLRRFLHAKCRIGKFP